MHAHTHYIYGREHTWGGPYLPKQQKTHIPLKLLTNTTKIKKKRTSSLEKTSFIYFAFLYVF